MVITGSPTSSNFDIAVSPNRPSLSQIAHCLADWVVHTSPELDIELGWAPLSSIISRLDHPYNTHCDSQISTELPSWQHPNRCTWSPSLLWSRNTQNSDIGRIFLPPCIPYQESLCLKEWNHWLNHWVSIWHSNRRQLCFHQLEHSS